MRRIGTAATVALAAIAGAQVLAAAPALAATSSARATARAFAAVTAQADIRIAAGSARAVREEGAVWSADRGFTGGHAITVAHATDALAQHARVGARSYSVTVPRPGNYRVALVLPLSASRSAIRLAVNGAAVSTLSPVRQGEVMDTVFSAKVAGRRLQFAAVMGSALVVSGIAIAATTPPTAGTAAQGTLALPAIPATAAAPDPKPLATPAKTTSTKASSGAPTAPSSAVPAASGTHWASGVWPGGSIDETASDAFAAYRGSSVDVATVYPDWSSWSQFATSTWYLDVYRDFPGRLSVGVPLVAPGGGTLGDVVAGKHDSYFLSWAHNLLAEGRGNSYLRLGWEFDGNWIPWAATDAGSYVAAFRHVVALIRPILPNAPIVWNGTLGESHVGHNPFTDLYPGDDVVDIVGVDAYDTQWHHVADAASWKQYQGTVNGLTAWLSFAKAHGKLFSVPEWGLNDQDGSGARDNAAYIADMHAFFAANAAALAFEAYFNEPADYIKSSLQGPDQNPVASAAYAALWSAQS